MSTGGKPRKTDEDVEAARPRRTYLPAAERRKSIIAAAQEVFARSNLKGARTRDIAAAAAVNQATIFEHFESKEALFQEAVVQPLIDAMRGMHARRELYDTAGSREELAKLGEVSARGHIGDMIDIFPLFTAALFSDPDLGRELYREHIAPLIHQRGQILEGLSRDGLDLDLVGLLIFGMTFAIALDRHYGDQGGQSDLSEVAKQFAVMATTGFARERTRKTDREKEDGSAT